jgi:hypothetical protein
MNFRLITNTTKMVAMLAMLSLASCKKDLTSNSGDTAAGNLSDSSTTADYAYYDVLNNAFIGFADNSDVWNANTLHSGKTTTMSTETLGTTPIGCAIYSFDDAVPGEYPKTMTMDFGTGCTGVDGVVRSGKIAYLFSGPIVSVGTTVAITFTNYVVNGYGVQGQYSITNNSNELVGISFNTQVINGIITYPNQTNYHYSHNKTFIQTAGTATTFDISDDVYSISGTSSFSNAEGNSLVFTADPLAPLQKAVMCAHISKGVVKFVYNNAINGSIDFGDGTCDNSAVLYVGNQHSLITLR